jgi:hypothetical protein
MKRLIMKRVIIKYLCIWGFILKWKREIKNDDFLDHKISSAADGVSF